MITVLRSITIEGIKLNDDLLAIIENGIDYEDECYFMTYFRSVNKHITLAQSFDRTGFEAFINSLHMEDFAKSNYIEQGLLFIDSFFKKFKEKKYEGVLKGFLVVTSEGALLKIHTVRTDETYYNESELDAFQEPVLIVTSDAEHFLNLVG